jgi:glycosyltransferase involved in cell wall biosynthesis
MSSLVSILIPAYNAADWITQTIQSALEQTWSDTEIIIVDDGSSDRTLEIAKTFTSSKIRIFTQTNQGAAAARNHALRLAQGDYIQFLDADDLIAPDKIEQQVKLLQTNSPNCIASGSWARFYDNLTTATFKPEPLWQDMKPVDWLVCAWNGHWMMHPAAWLVPRSIAEAAGSWDETLSLNDDGEYFCRVVLASRFVKFCTEAKSYYRSGLPGSLSDWKSDAAYASAYRAIAQCSQQLLHYEDSSRTRQVCATLFQRFIYETYPAVPILRQQAQQQVQNLGGTPLKPTGSPMFQYLSSLIGWRMAKWIQQSLYQSGYRAQKRNSTAITQPSTS